MNVSLAGRPVPGLWPSVGKLLRLRWTIWISGFRRAKRGRKIGMILLALLALSGLVFVFVLSWLLLRFLQSPELARFVGDTQPFLDSVPVLIVTAAFIGILITSFGVLLQALYLAGDMEFLLSAPLPIRAVFVTKMLQAILPNFGLILLFGLPVLFGLGASQHYNPLFYPLVLILLAILALAAAGISSLLVMLIVRVFPARRVAEVIGLVVGVSSLLCSQTGQLWGDVSRQQTADALRLITRANTPWSPLAWAGRALVEVGEGRLLTGIPLLLLIAGLSGGIFALSLVTAERLYYSGWASLQGTPRKKKAAQAKRRDQSQQDALSTLAGRLFSKQVTAIVQKDFTVLRRDLRNLSQLMTPLILGIIYSVTLLRRGGAVPAGRGEAPEWFMQALSNLFVYANVGLSLFVAWSLLSRLALMGFSQEGHSYWLVKTAPVDTRRLLTAKFLVAYLPALALSWGFLLVISILQGATLPTLFYSLVVVGMTIAGTAGLNLGFGVVGSNFDWSDPRHMQRGSAGCVGSLVSMLYLAASLALFFGPPVLVELIGGPQVAGQILGLAIGGITSLACAVLPLWLVRARVAHLGEG